MTSTAPHDLTTLRSRLGGQVVLPGDPGYDQAREMWNGRVVHRPGVIVRCTGPEDIAETLGFARRAGLEIAVRGGGHGAWTSLLDDGFCLLDLSPLDRVVVDPVARTARCGGGALLGQLDAATQEHGLAVPAGTVSNTGVGGLTLGGGWGWLSALHGLTIDSLLSAEVVLADGRIVHASETEHPDLFWALRGGGGNFGVVTEFEFGLHPVGPVVQLGMVFVPQDRVAELVAAAPAVFAALPASVSAGLGCISAPPAPFVPAEHHFTPGAAFLIVGFGEPAEHAAAVEMAAAAVDPLFVAGTPLPYVALQQMLDEAAVPGTRSYTKGLYLPDLTPELGEVLAARTALRSPISQVLIFPLSRAVGAVPDDATAFAGPRSGYAAAVEAIGQDPATDDAERDWARGTWDALRPFAHDAGGYLNLMTEPDRTAVDDSYGAKYARLARIKAEYDPENLLHVNPNIAPA